MKAKNRVFDLAKQECRAFDFALASLKNIVAENEEYFENISERAKRLSLETTMTQEEALYFLSCNLEKLFL